MDEWTPVLALPNLDMRGTLECPYAAIVARVPALAASVFYDTGRLLSLWVSAYEILAHPGGTSQSNFGTVSALLESVKWQDQKLAGKVFPGWQRQEDRS
jgi:hypothetical protein